MAKYIYTDKDGNILREEPKGRGKTKKEAVQNEDGDWVIIEQDVATVTPIKLTKPVTPKVIESDEEPDEDFEEESSSERARRYGKKHDITPGNRITFDELTGSMSQCNCYQDNHIVTFGPGVIILRSLGLPFMIVGAQPIYGKIEANLVTGDVGFYTFATSEFPDHLAVHLLE